MAGNTVMTAKNSFLKGILMDFSPENTSADSLTSALNATFVTFNGNEGSLLNDMGNGRVETAYLPEGYVPVGSCEFGDIIYIVSYNPLIDKAQIGCFPSPERNLSSDELGQESITIKSDKFLEINENGNLTGKLKTGSVKEILYKSNLNPGDQYVVYYDSDTDVSNVTDYGTTSRLLNGLPRLLNIKVVSIEDNGKMTVLDSNVKWYDLPTSQKQYFKFVPNKSENDEGELDLDLYRSIVSSAYNIYSSKVSGKLALLIELEKISGFSCGWEALTSNREIKILYCILNPTDTPNLSTIWYNEFKEVENLKEEVTNGIIWFRYDIEPESNKSGYINKTTGASNRIDVVTGYCNTQNTNDLFEINNTISKVTGYIDSQTGLLVTHENWISTDFKLIEDCISININDINAFRDNYMDTTPIAFYDENKQFISSISEYIIPKQGSWRDTLNVAIPNNTTYIRICWTTDTINWSTPRKYSEQNLPHEYDIYFNYSWETNNKNINPKYSILTQSIIEDENGINVNTLTNDIRNEIIIPDLYDELNPTPLHTFGRLYKPENGDSYYLYDDYVKKYLNGPVFCDLNLINDPTFTNVTNNWGNPSGIFDIDSGIFKSTYTNNITANKLRQVLYNILPNTWYELSFKIKGWCVKENSGLMVSIYNRDYISSQFIDTTEFVFIDGVLNNSLNVAHGIFTFPMKFNSRESYENSLKDWIIHTIVFKTTDIVTQINPSLYFSQQGSDIENSAYFEITEISLKKLSEGKIMNSGNLSNSNITTILHVLENGKYQFDSEIIGNETVEVGKYLLNATRGEVLLDEYKYYNNNREIIPVTVSDDVINNTFKTQVRKKLGTFVVPGNQPNINYHYKICPAMPYGMLEEYTIDDVIQLDKLGTTNVLVKDWRYYVYSNLLTLTWGLDAYTEPGKEISEVILEFYDNCGICAAYHANNFNSYNGTFTINIPLNNSNQVLNAMTWEGETFIHAGKQVVGNIEKDDNGNDKPIYIRNNKTKKYSSSNEIIGYDYVFSNVKQGKETYYYDDSGIIYSNLLYLVKIIVKVESKLSTGEYITNDKPLVFYRWLWTNSLFNNNYQSNSDFDYIQPVLNLDLNCSYSTKTSDNDGLVPWNVLSNDQRVVNYNNKKDEGEEVKISILSLSINSAEKSNIKMTPIIWIKNNYETFKLNTDYFNDMNVIVSLANEYVENSTDQPVVEFYNGNIPEVEFLLAEELKLRPSEFKLNTKTEGSEYAIDVKIQNKNDYFKINKYGRLL